jgi:hypothetical protein
MNCQEHAAFKAFCLAGAGRFEGLTVAGEPYVNDLIAAHPFIDAPGDRFHLRQLRHFLIVGEQ